MLLLGLFDVGYEEVVIQGNKTKNFARCRFATALANAIAVSAIDDWTHELKESLRGKNKQAQRVDIMTEFVVILVLLGFAWFWQDSLRVREMAIALAKDFCAKENVQFLDGAVAAVSMRLKRDGRGRVVVARNYQFEFTDTGNNRLQGTMIMLGHTLETMHLPRFGEI